MNLLSKKLILEMKEYVEKDMNSKFLFVQLESFTQKKYIDNLSSQMNFLNLHNNDIARKPGWFVEGDGHPNKKMNN